MCRRYPNATEVNVTGASAMHLLVMRAVSSLRCLVVIFHQFGVASVLVIAAIVFLNTSLGFQVMFPS